MFQIKRENGMKHLSSCAGRYTGSFIPNNGVYLSYDMIFKNTTIPVNVVQMMFGTRHC